MADTPTSRDDATRLALAALPAASWLGVLGGVSVSPLNCALPAEGEGSASAACPSPSRPSMSRLIGWVGSAREPHFCATEVAQHWQLCDVSLASALQKWHSRPKQRSRKSIARWNRAECPDYAETLSKSYSTYPVAHILVGMVELGNQGRILGQLAFSNADAESRRSKWQKFKQRGGVDNNPAL
ncbi:MAG: hypothetical protein FRX49_02068 [Trebouxia sp. A1-2]|nr:MAG: hypothetical protein FRX49_02068 [Trebouxia sp. A1-2]